MGVYTPTKLLRVADASRRGEAPATPHELWQLADRESAGVQTKRIELYRHAMVHAGHLLAAATGERYPVCPMCEEALG